MQKTIKDRTSARETDPSQRSARICPYCAIAFSIDGVNAVNTNLRFESTPGLIYGAEESQRDPNEKDFTCTNHRCPGCRGQIIWLNKIVRSVGGDGGRGERPTERYISETTLLFPKLVVKKLPCEVPENLARDFQEAFQTLEISPKASAALSRRCLQTLIRTQLDIKKRTLFAEVEALLATGRIPRYLAEDLDAIRGVGNFAAHPEKDSNTGEIVQVEPDEAEWTFSVLEKLLNFFYVEEPRSIQKREELNAKLEGAGKGPILSP